MVNNENNNPSGTSGSTSVSALELGPRRKAYVFSFLFLSSEAEGDFDRRSTDPLVSSGRHFARTIHALCNLHALISNGIIRMGERADEPDEAFTAQ